MTQAEGKLLILVRHGETDFNAARIIQMPAASLSVNGRSQSALLADRLAGAGITRIVSSDFPRAAETAAVVSDRTGVVVAHDARLRERDFGDLIGRSYDSLPSSPLPLDFVPPNGESPDAFFGRMAEAWELITGLLADTRGNLLVVTHGLVCKALVSKYVEPTSVGTVPRFWINTSVTEINAASPWAARRVNCVAHLRDQARSK
jgi:broad specificity phosphatase PhoE